MPWIFYGDGDYCSCPHCESEEETDMKFIPFAPSVTAYSSDIEPVAEVEYHFQPLPNTNLFYRLTTDSIGTPVASLHVWLASTSDPWNQAELLIPEKSRLEEYTYSISEAQELLLWNGTPPEEVFSKEIQESLKSWNIGTQT